MATLRKPLFFFLVLVILGAGGYAQSYFEETLRRAEQGNAVAQSNLGYAYAHGSRGVPQDLQESAKWYRMAADQGHAVAQYWLGVAYKNGRGVLRDYKEAAKWYRMAANQGNVRAQAGLGWMYTEGKGVSRNNLLAHIWTNLALSQETRDHTRSSLTQSLNTLERKMSPEQIAEALKLAREFKPKGKNE